MSRYQDFTAAKQVIRVHPDWTDAQVAEQLDISERDRTGMVVIAEARKDVAAGDITARHQEHRQPPS